MMKSYHGKREIDYIPTVYKKTKILKNKKINSPLLKNIILKRIGVWNDNYRRIYS